MGKEFKIGGLTDKGVITNLFYFRKGLILVEVKNGSKHSPEHLNIIENEQDQSTRPDDSCSKGG